MDEQVVELEQHFIDSLKPNLNVDLVASGSGHHEPMSQEMREKLRKQRGTPVYMYNVEDLALLYAFDSKQQVYDLINMHHNTLNDCVNYLSVKMPLDCPFLSFGAVHTLTSQCWSFRSLKHHILRRAILHHHPLHHQTLSLCIDQTYLNIRKSLAS